MFTIDQYACRSRLKGVSPAAKAIFSLGTLLICISAESIVVSMAVFCGMFAAAVWKSGLTYREFIGISLIPLGFVLIGAITVAVEFSPAATGWINVPFFGGYLLVTAQGALRGTGLLLKSMGGISCLIFLYVSTGVPQLLALLERLHLPQIFTELAMLIYRFIFVFLEMASQIRVAQLSRMGNRNISVALRSWGLLGAAVFVKAFRRAMDTLNAMESRGYDGGVSYMGDIPPMIRSQKWGLGVYLLVLIIAVFFMSGQGEILWNRF